MRARTMVLALIAGALAGCGSLNEYKIDSRNHRLARRAWNCMKHVYADVDYPYDFGLGFQEGYFDVASGGNGCPPLLPPKRYWTANLANPLGHRRTHAWFEGYKYGALVAEQDGVGVWLTMPSGRPEPPPPVDISSMLPAKKDEGKSTVPGRGAESSEREEDTAPLTVPPTPEPTPPTPAPPTPGPADKPAPPAPKPAEKKLVVKPKPAAPPSKAATTKPSTKLPPRQMPVEIPPDIENGGRR